MSSRRSRLKAVANLPVRRKPGFPETSSEVPPSDNISSEKNFLVTSSTESVDDINKIQQSCEPKKTISPNSRNNINNNYLRNDEQEVTNDTEEIEFTDQQTQIIDEMLRLNSEDKNVNTLKSNIDLHKNGSLNQIKHNQNISTSFKSRRVRPNLVASVQREKVQTQAHEKVVSSEGFQKENLISFCNSVIKSSEYKNNTTNNSIEENGKSYTILTPPNPADVSVSTYTSLTPCEPIGGTTVNNLYSFSENQEYEEIHIYTDLEERTDLYVYPTAVNNIIDQSSELEIVSDHTDSTFSVVTDCSGSPVNQRTVNTVCKGSNILNTENVSQNFFLKPTFKNIAISNKNIVNGCDEYLGSSTIIVRDKSVLGNSNFIVSQNISSDSHSLNTDYKRNISAIRRKRSKCNDFTKKLADARRKFQKKYEKTKPDRSTLKMIDLIFYNPSTNPMESKSKLEKKQVLFDQEKLIQEKLDEEKVDEPEALVDSSGLQGTNDTEEENLNKMPVPQVKIGLNGEIILDEKSLLIETTDAKKGREDLQNSLPIFEDKGSKVSYYRGKTKKTRDWTDFETKRFYKALNTIGPDFSLMQKYFPKRSRLELKNKFKREERLNRNLIDKALNNPSEFDMTQLENDLAVEKKAEEEDIEMKLCKVIKEKRTSKRPRKKSVLSREMIECDGEAESNQLLTDTSSKLLCQNEMNKRRKEVNFIYHKLMQNSEKQDDQFSNISSSCSLKPGDHGVR